MLGDGWEQERIEYNEELQRWEYKHKNVLQLSGDFNACLTALGERLKKDGCEDIEGALNDFLYCRESDSDLDGYLMQDRIDATRKETEALDIALQFAVDVLDIMRETKQFLTQADGERRTKAKREAYDIIQELIDKTSAKMRDEHLI